MDIIKALRDSGNRLLQSEAEDIEMWKHLKHNKEDLENFLNYNIAEIKFKTKDQKDVSLICTSNTTLIRVMQQKKSSEKKKLIKESSRGIKTNESFSVMTWDLIALSMKTINLSSWQIMNFLTITEKNILLLDQLLHDILKLDSPK